MTKNCGNKDSTSYVDISIILGIIQVEQPKELKKKKQKKQKKRGIFWAFIAPSYFRETEGVGIIYDVKVKN